MEVVVKMVFGVLVALYNCRLVKIKSSKGTVMDCLFDLETCGFKHVCTV